MDEKDFDFAKRKFISIMNKHCKEYVMDEPDFQEWNIRDYVSECQYWIDFEKNQIKTEGAEYGDDDMILWCENFVREYLKHSKGIKAVTKHCSKYDN